ncbi:unnamed protein product [Pleuronectes platessa]|uniref:Uncharacterized protein n=1 Tax=Pleuronectes platessa TaxID=8262 RepID=A0A9N7W1X5_PLEPL|nr:unnamed protein product [Pleuronectes platessa]
MSSFRPCCPSWPDASAVATVWVLSHRLVALQLSPPHSNAGCVVSVQLSGPSCGSGVRNPALESLDDTGNGSARLKTDVGPPTVIVSRPSHPFSPPSSHSCFTRGNMTAGCGNRARYRGLCDKPSYCQGLKHLSDIPAPTVDQRQLREICISSESQLSENHEQETRLRGTMGGTSCCGSRCDNSEELFTGSRALGSGRTQAYVSSPTVYHSSALQRCRPVV